MARSRRKPEPASPAAAPPIARLPTWRGPRLVFLVAVAVRVVYLLESADNPTFLTPVMDASDYDNLARSNLTGAAPSTSLFWQPVFYPFYLTVVYFLSGSSIWAAKLAQAVLGGLTCALTCVLGARLLDRRAGLVAGLVTALYGPLIFFEGELLATGWAAFWTVALLLMLLQAAERPRAFGLLLLGVSAAAAVLTRPTFVPFLFTAAAWLLVTWWRRPAARAGVARNAALLAAGVILVLLPTSLLNWRVHQHFGFMPASGGINLYIGNNPQSDTTIAFRPGRDWDRLMALPAERGVANDAWARDRFFYGLAREYALTRPVAFCRGLLDKAVQFVSARELPRSVDVYVFRPWSATLTALMWKIGGFGFPFGVLLPLGVLGLVVQARRVPVPVWLLLILYPLAIVLVFTAARYRVPLVPVLSIYAAGGALWLIERLRAGDVRRVGAGSVALAALAIAMTWPGPFPAERFNYAAELHLLLGNRLVQEKDLGAAVVQFEAGLAHDPASRDLHANLAEARLELGDTDGAIRHYEAALRAAPHAAVNHVGLGVALHRAGQFERAITHYRRALEIDPTYGKVYSNLGAALQANGQRPEAIEAFRRAAALEPREFICAYNLAAAYAEEGQLERAMTEFRRALALEPNSFESHHGLAVALARLGRRSEARGAVDRALQLNPQYGPALRLRAELDRDPGAP